MEERQKRCVYIHTSGVDTPDRTATPFYLATAAAVTDYDTTLVFTTKSTSLLRKGVAENLRLKGGKGATLKTFMDQAREAGVKFLVCAPSLDLNDMTRDDLIDDVDEIIGGAALNDLVLEADLVLTF
jgi:predicted peroxiredoxin